jgi:DNA-binding NarL/FixJ family response regulator
MSNIIKMEHRQSIMVLKAQGRSDRKIAKELALNPRTHQKRVNNLLRLCCINPGCAAARGMQKKSPTRFSDRVKILLRAYAVFRATISEELIP